MSRSRSHNWKRVERTDISDRELSALVHGRIAVTQDMALRLARALHTTPELWLSM